MSAVEFVVTGVVQGVGFRWFTQKLASRLGLRGWVRNRSDGTVQVRVVGDDRVIHEFEEQLKQGPPGAVVESVTRFTVNGNQNYESFEVTG